MNYDITKRLKGKAKIEKETETVKPTVINDKLIRYLLYYQTTFREYLVTFNKENRIFDNDDMPLWQLTHLSLSYKSSLLILMPSCRHHRN